MKSVDKIEFDRFFFFLRKSRKGESHTETAAFA